MDNLENIRVLVLASILTANEFGEIDLNVVMNSQISKEWFLDEAQATMFEVMSVCYNGSIAFDDSVIMNYMKKAGITHPENMLLNIMAQKQVPQNVLMEHILTLKEAYCRRMLQVLNSDIAKMLQDENISSDAVTQMVQNSIDDYAILSHESPTKTLTEVRKRRKAKPPMKRIASKIPFIDTVLTDKHGNKGFRDEGLVFISGRKESGKTFIATKIVEKVSKEHHVMFGSMEFGEDLYDETIEEQQEEHIFDGNTDNIHIFDDIYEIKKVAAEIRLQHKLFGIKLVVLDSALRMKNNNKDLKTDERRISDMFSILGKLSKELKIPIIIIVQSAKEDLKSGIISVKGSTDADHEAYVWIHLAKTKIKDPENELRTVIWAKNKDTRKHPKQHLMFVPQTSDFYRVEIDEHGNAGKALDKFRAPPFKHVEIVYEDTAKTYKDAPTLDMPVF